jgi:hypothetical protein
MDFTELRLWRASRPTGPHPTRGRQLCALELFSGCSIVTQAFADRRWRVRSIDNSVFSNATTIADIMRLNYDEHVGMVPDFIWASPPCFTYSHLAGKFFILCSMHLNGTKASGSSLCSLSFALQVENIGIQRTGSGKLHQKPTSTTGSCCECWPLCAGQKQKTLT